MGKHLILRGSSLAVLLHPKPMAEAGRVLAWMEGNRRCSRLDVHDSLSGEER